MIQLCKMEKYIDDELLTDVDVDVQEVDGEGDEMYEQMMEIARRQKEEAALERKKKKEKVA